MLSDSLDQISEIMILLLLLQFSDRNLDRQALDSLLANTLLLLRNTLLVHTKLKNMCLFASNLVSAPSFDGNSEGSQPELYPESLMVSIGIPSPQLCSILKGPRVPIQGKSMSSLGVQCVVFDIWGVIFLASATKINTANLVHFI